MGPTFLQPTLSPELIDSVKRFEGFTPRAKWDYKQHSVGYGTRARYPGEAVDEVEADRRLRDELAKARALVEQHAPNAPDGIKNALTSLTFNAGGSWTQAGLGDAVRRGDYADAQRRFLQYTRAGGAVLPGLVSRRRQEASWWGAPGAGQGRMGLGGPQPQNAFSTDTGSSVPAFMQQEQYVNPMGETGAWSGQPTTGWRDQPPMASARQQSPQSYGRAFQQNAFSTPKWGSDHYGSFIDWSDSKGRALERGRSYV